MSGTRRGRALVVGGGFAGLVTARALAEHFDRVRVLDKDTLPDRAAHRPGTPQSRHPHALLARGAELLEDLFPGLREELTGHGAPVSDFGQFPMLYPTGWSPAVRTELVLQTFSRPLLEFLIRRRVQALPNVTFHTATEAEALLVHDSRVTGVVARPRSTGRPTAHEADLVVVADGRHSRLPTWLEKADHPPVRRLRVDGKLAYTSRLYQRPPDTDPGFQASLQATIAPTTPSGGTVIAIEDDRWLVCLFGAGGISAPTTPEGFDAYAATLDNPHVKQIVVECRPISAIHRYSGLGGHWNRYDRLSPPLRRLAVVGDALCALNPLYGHGMTVATQQALLLRDAITAHSLDQADGVYHRHAARTLLLPWLMTTSLDRGWSPEPAPLPARASRTALLHLLHRIPDHPGLYRKFLNVQHMVASPLTLLLPFPRRHRQGPRP
ncbi:FAD-binding protein [Streptomyces roseoverticillatus]|uniref:FAD-dependent oxidoreductase n=1 Tax=Streptomyces roseoverticillatus TaxID=66429 RepID=UPI001F3F1454|nr:FAD-binding protein [Streptomyces roseoverticillatus]MCF3104867.1 FAD-binding protein [Streptomyces roseoverticillatus]